MGSPRTKEIKNSENKEGGKMKKETPVNSQLPSNVKFKKGKYYVAGKVATRKEVEGIEWLMRRHMDGMRYGEMSNVVDR